jgi:hypothetical protein
MPQPRGTSAPPPMIETSAPPPMSGGSNAQADAAATASAQAAVVAAGLSKYKCGFIGLHPIADACRPRWMRGRWPRAGRRTLAHLGRCQVQNGFLSGGLSSRGGHQRLTGPGVVFVIHYAI